LIHGPAGVGKSTVVSHVLEELAANTRVRTAWINCWQYNTRPSLITELLIQLGYPVPRKGKPVDTMLTRFREWLDKHTGAGIALDEFDQLRTPAQVVYDLLETGRQAGHDIGLILISNQSPDTFDLDARSDSRLRYRSVAFQPYTPAELKEILRRRADQAFHDGALGDQVIEAIVDRIADAGRDCRKAFTLLLRAGQYAEREDASLVTVDHVEQVAPLS
jgi:cell division control protein 6